MKPPKLFRGDKKGNLTRPEYHGTAGLLTKLINNGDPAYITKFGIVEAIREHIAPSTDLERLLWSQSHFLSFSASLQRALFFAADNEPDKLLPGEGDNQRYLFSLDTSSCSTTEHGGVYSLAYDCDFNCEYCKDGKQKHHLLLIDVVTYLSVNDTFAKTADALNNARRDFEWLILPIDYFPRLHGFQARIVPSAVWDVDYYFLNK